MGPTILSSDLIQMIESVSSSESQNSAIQSLLRSLLKIFQMDQAALFSRPTEKSEAGGGDDLVCLLAIDRTGRILKSGDGADTKPDGVFSSKTLLNRAFLTMEPLLVQVATHDELTPLSIKSDDLRQIACLPLSRSPNTAIFLGSRAVASHRYTEEEIKQFKTAAKASWLAIHQFKTQELLATARNEIKSLRETKTSLLYYDGPMSAAVEEIDRVAPFNVSILLLGESGVGKEEFARHIHNKSNRQGSFVAINCANLSESLLESELFGYRKGAFTGASQNKQGLFSMADGGTLFLDEIAELPYNLQAKLLRVLQERKIRPVGGTEDVSIDVRVIAATHQDLESRIERGEFREDLFYRVHEFTVKIPPLRERGKDIELLAEHFVTQASVDMNLPRKRLSQEALAHLREHSWPGNIRELKSICRTAVILAKEAEIRPMDLRFTVRQVPSLVPTQTASKATLNAFTSVSGNPGAQAQPSIPMTHSGGAVPLDIEGQSLRELSKGFEKQIVKKMLSEGLAQVDIASRLGISVRTLQRILSDDVRFSEPSTADL